MVVQRGVFLMYRTGRVSAHVIACFKVSEVHIHFDRLGPESQAFPLP